MSRLSAADFGVELANRGIPSELAGLKLTSWSVGQLQRAVKELGGRAKGGALKIDLCQQLRNLKPNGSKQAALKQREWRTLRGILKPKLAAKKGSAISSQGKSVPKTRSVGPAGRSQAKRRPAATTNTNRHTFTRAEPRRSR
jgi:hypothetical protein